MKNPFADKILFLRVIKKDSEAFGQFYDLYVDRIYRFIYFKISSTEDAKDLTSEVFLRTWQYIKDDKAIKNLNAFIYMVAKNSIIDFYRSRARKEENEEFVSIGHLNISDDSQLAKQISNSDMEEVLKSLAALKDEYREVIVLHYLNELSIKEIALILDKTPGNVRVLLYRALTGLKGAVNK